MPDINPIAVGAATVAAFFVSSTWYAVFGAQSAAIRGVDVAEVTQRPPAWKMGVELARSLVVAVALAAVIALGAIDDWAGIALVAAAAWLAFPVALLTGSVIWENVPGRLAMLHAGDWLVKLLVVALLIGVLQ